MPKLPWARVTALPKRVWPACRRCPGQGQPPCPHRALPPICRPLGRSDLPGVAGMPKVPWARVTGLRKHASRHAEVALDKANRLAHTGAFGVILPIPQNWQIWAQCLLGSAWQARLAKGCLPSRQAVLAKGAGLAKQGLPSSACNAKQSLPSCAGWAKGACLLAR